LSKNVSVVLTSLWLGLTPMLSACSGGSDGVATRPEGGSPPTQYPDASVDAGAPAGEDLDGSRVDDSSQEASTPASDDGGESGAPADGGARPSGTRLAIGNVLELEGITSDEYAVYIDGIASTLNAVPLAGGAPSEIATVDPTTVVAVVGPVVFFWTGVSQVTGAGALGIWTSAHGAQPLSTSSQVAGVGIQAVSVSGNGGRVVFYDQLDPAGTSGDLDVASVDGTGKATLLTSLDLTATSPCYPVFRFAGEAVVAAYTEVGASASAPFGATLSSFQAPSWTPTPLVTEAQCGLDVDRSGTLVLGATETGLFAFGLAGGAPLEIDPIGGLGLFVGAPDAGASGVVYTDGASELKRASVSASPSPTVLVDGGLGTLVALSGDESWILADLQVDFSTGLSDLYLASASVQGSAIVLAAGATGAIVGDPFTDDSTYALYATEPADPDAGTALSLFATASTGSTASAQARTLAAGVGVAFASGGARVVYSASDPSNPREYDIFVVDLSTSAPPVPLVLLADSPFFVSPRKDKVVYTWSQTAGVFAGLYVLAMPTGSP
jgi:hypothetical protein